MAAFSSMGWKSFTFALFQAIHFLLIGPIYSQNYSSDTQFRLNNFSTESGLSQGNIYKIYKDLDGFVWVASEDGLNRFDGYNFRVFKHDEEDTTSISDNIVWCITEDQKGTLWVGTNQGGLCKYDKRYATFKSFVHDPKNPQSISQNTVEAICETSDGRLWIGTHWGLNVFDPNTEKFTSIFMNSDPRYPGLLDNKIFSIVEAASGEIWVGNGIGISVFDLAGKHIKNIKGGEYLNFPKGRVTNMLKEKNGNIWASIDGAGLVQYRKTREDFKLYRNEPNNPYSLGNPFIRSLLLDSDSLLWVGMDGYGFQVFDRKTQKFDRALQNSNIEPDQIEKVYEIYHDDKDNFWFGAYGHGLFVLNSNSDNFTHYSRIYHDKNSLSNNSILAISEASNGRIYLGTDGGGINMFDPEDQSFVHLNDVKNGGAQRADVVKSLLFDSKGNLWAGTFNHGLEVRWNGADTFERLTVSNSGLQNENVWALLEDQNQKIWIGTLGAGINTYDPKSGKITKYGTLFDGDSTLSSVDISCLLGDSKNQVWIGTIGHGICVIDPDTGKQRRFGHASNDSTSLSHNEIRYLFESSKEEIWIGTTHGLNKFNQADQTFERYFETDGLPSHVIKGIVEDDEGMFWVSSNNGVFRFSPETEEVTSFNRSDGLQGKEFNYNSSIKASDGRIYFGGLNGFNQFDPKKVRSNDNQPGILFTRFRLFNRPIPISEDGPLKKEINQIERLEFNYDEYIFTIEYAADEYQFPKKNEYQYKLEGFEPEWNKVGQSRSATYTNLPAGEYVFMVRASNNSGVWSDKIRKLQIVVYPPWWQTNWAYSVFVIVGVLMVIAIVRFRTSYLHAQKIKLRNLVRKRTRELQEKNEKITMQAEELNAFNDTLNAVNESLEKKVVARTNELLIKNRKLSDYAFLNAHNLRAPVANIKGLVQLFNFDLDEDEKKEIIENLKKQVEDVDSVLLDINRRLKEDSQIDEKELNKPSDQSTSSSRTSS